MSHVHAWRKKWTLVVPDAPDAKPEERVRWWKCACGEWKTRRTPFKGGRR